MEAYRSTALENFLGPRSCYDREYLGDLVPAFYTMFYCKAVALQALGKCNQAIKAFEHAIECDPGCHATYYQLDALIKRRKELNLGNREKEEERSRAKELILRRQEKKYRHSLRRASERNNKKARGLGHVVGVRRDKS